MLRPGTICRHAISVYVTNHRGQLSLLTLLDGKSAVASVKMLCGREVQVKASMIRFRGGQAGKTMRGMSCHIQISIQVHTLYFSSLSFCVCLHLTSRDKTGVSMLDFTSDICPHYPLPSEAALERVITTKSTLHNKKLT